MVRYMDSTNRMVPIFVICILYNILYDFDSSHSLVLYYMIKSFTRSNTPQIYIVINIYGGESIIIRPVCFIFRKTRAVDQTGESESVRSRLYRGCSTTSKFNFLRFSTVWAVSASVMDVDWRPFPSPCLTLVRPFLKLSFH